MWPVILPSAAPVSTFCSRPSSVSWKHSNKRRIAACAISCSAIKRIRNMTTVNKLTLEDSLQNENVLAFSTDSDILAQNSGRLMKVRKAPSLFNVITGPRGSLKTLLLTMLACRNLLKCFYFRYYGITKHVWTNYPIGFYHRSMLDD